MFTATFEQDGFEFEVEIEYCITGHNIPATLIDPPEYPECEIESINFIEQDDFFIDDGFSEEDFKELFYSRVEAMLDLMELAYLDDSSELDNDFEELLTEMCFNNAESEREDF